MVFTILNIIEFTFRKKKPTKMAIWHIMTHFVVEGHILGEIFAYVTVFQSNHRGSHIPFSKIDDINRWEMLSVCSYAGNNGILPDAGKYVFK